ncbi:MAG: methyltransferase domain-containing protein, partial [Burkholderiaceae bacterium]|nr:methyltransferase domain-containing protein [Burkholderiaceae bacterium]
MEGHRARKRFSQNFLHDAHYIARIVDAIAPVPGDRIVEIGPGLGALTAPLVERAGHVTCVEIDRDLAARLRARFAPAQLTVIEADALQLDWRALVDADPRPVKV